VCGISEPYPGRSENPEVCYNGGWNASEIATDFGNWVINWFPNQIKTEDQAFHAICRFPGMDIAEAAKSATKFQRTFGIARKLVAVVPDMAKRVPIFAVLGEWEKRLDAAMRHSLAKCVSLDQT
jgi:hypothetical protein